MVADQRPGNWASHRPTTYRLVKQTVPEVSRSWGPKQTEAIRDISEDDEYPSSKGRSLSGVVHRRVRGKVRTVVGIQRANIDLAKNRSDSSSDGGINQRWLRSDYRIKLDV